MCILKSCFYTEYFTASKSATSECKCGICELTQLGGVTRFGYLSVFLLKQTKHYYVDMVNA